MGSESVERALQSLDAPETPTKIAFSIAQTPSDHHVDHVEMEEALSQAQQGIGNVKSLPRPIGDIGSVVDALPVVTAAVKSFADTWSSLLDKLEIFTQITDQLAEVRSRIRH